MQPKLRVAHILRAAMLTMAMCQVLAAQTLPSTNSRSNQAYGKLPLIFEANQGQTSPQVKFVSRGQGYTAFLTGGGMVLSLRPAKAVSSRNAATPPQASQQTSRTTLEFRLVGAARNAAVVGENLQPGRANYFIGNDPSKWQRNVPTYAQVRYRNVYPGIDLVYYGNHQQMEFDFAVAKGADPSLIRFEVKGASQLSTDEAGNLLVRTSNSTLHFQMPVIYEECGGQRTPIPGSYSLLDANHFGFQLAKYDSSKPVVIDPVLVYSTYLGGSGSEQASGIAVDSTGSLYIVGYTDSVDFPLATIGSLPAGADHVFVAKLDPTGSHLVYADYLGGSGLDYGTAIAVGPNDNLYITGGTSSSDFPLVNPLISSLPGYFNAFVTKISADGSSLLYSTYLGGNAWDQPSAVAVDSMGNIYLAGNTTSSNFPTANALQSSASANQGGAFGQYGFVSKLTPDGSSFAYSTYLAGNSNVVQSCGSNQCWPSPYNSIQGMAIDANGNAYLTGITNTYNFPTTEGSYQGTNKTAQDTVVAFISKLSSNGSLGYSSYFYEGSGNQTDLSAIAVDSTGSAYVAGSAPSDGTFPITTKAICDPSVYGWACGPAFVAKFDPTGSSLLYSTFLGPYNNASPQALVLDDNNDAYVVSSSSSTWQGQFSTVNAIETLSSGVELLVVELDASASTQLFATFLGGSGDDFPSGIAVDSNKNIYVAGTTSSTDLPVTPGAFQTIFGGNTDAFLTKIGPSAAPAVSVNPASLQFPSTALGSTSQAQSFLLRNMGSAALSLKIQTSGDFGETDNCGTSVAPSNSCTVSVTFTPTALGSRSGSIALVDNAAGSPQTIALSGLASGSDFTIASSAPSQTVNAGAKASYSLSVSSVGGSFSHAVSLSCSGAPAGATCSISPTSVTPGNSSASVTVTITTTTTVSDATPHVPSDNHMLYATWIQLQSMGLFGLVVAGTKKRSARTRTLALLVLALFGLLMLVGCAGGTGIAQTGSSGGTTAGTYTVVVTGTSGSVHHSLSLTLVVK